MLKIDEYLQTWQNWRTIVWGTGAMASSINLSLTDELREFIDRNTGDGSEYATPSEFLRDVLREKKRRMEAAALRDAIIAGYQDVTEGRFVEFTGSLRGAIAEAKRREEAGWR